MTYDSVRDFLGDTTPAITDDELARLDDLFSSINARWSDPDDWDERNAALSAAVQVVLGDATLEGIGADYQKARQRERAASAALTGALLASTGSEETLRQRAGVNRMTVRRALGRSVK